MGTEVFGGGTVDVWWGAVDATEPEPNVDPPAAWSLIGEGFISEDGLSADLANTITKVFTLSSTAPQRIYRTQEEPMIEFSLFESTMEALSISLHGTTNQVEAQAAASGVIGKRTVPIKRGATVREASVLFRSVSPYDTDPDVNEWKFQGYLPRGVFTKVGSFKFFKEQLTLPLTFELLESTSGNGLGQMSSQDANALP